MPEGKSCRKETDLEKSRELKIADLLEAVVGGRDSYDGLLAQSV